jgi:hypothetical protein
MQIGGEVVLISLQEYVALNLLIGWIRYTYTYTVFLNVKGTFTFWKQLVIALNLFSLGEKIWIHSGHLYLILTTDQALFAVHIKNTSWQICRKMLCPGFSLKAAKEPPTSLDSKGGKIK